MLVDQMERLSVSQRFRKYQQNGSAKTNRERSVERLQYSNFETRTLCTVCTSLLHVHVHLYMQIYLFKNFL